MDVDAKLIELAETKHMLVNRADVATVMSSRQWCRRVDSGLWSPVAPGVWRHCVTPLDWKLQARAGLRSLGREAALHGRTACGWWALGDLNVGDVEFVVPRSRKNHSFPFVLHTTRHWDTKDLLVHDGLRLTSASRTIIDLAGIGTTAGQLETVIDDAIRARLTSLPTLRKRLAVLSGKGVVGGSLLRALLLDTGGDSHLERRFLEVVRRAGLPRPTCQVVHRSGGQRIARVDFQFPETNIIVEVSGRLGHVSDRDRQRDAHRRNALQVAGNIVLEFTTADVLDGQPYVVATLAAQLAFWG